MFTHGYKGRYIHGYCDRDDCHVTGLGWFKSYRAAQLGITRSLGRRS